jgi:hypothetical protein
METVPPTNKKLLQLPFNLYAVAPSPPPLPFPSLPLGSRDDLRGNFRWV